MTRTAALTLELQIKRKEFKRRRRRKKPSFPNLSPQSPTPDLRHSRKTQICDYLQLLSKINCGFLMKNIKRTIRYEWGLGIILLQEGIKKKIKNKPSNALNETNV